jgi:hypothetical protein
VSTMGQRLQLHDILKNVLGSSNVYFQPPVNLKMAYPCIVYQRDDARTEHADNLPYSFTQRYQVTLIDPKVDSEVYPKLTALPLCSYQRFYTADNLNHDVFVLYY